MADDFSQPGNDGGGIPAPYDKDEPDTRVHWLPPRAELPAAFVCDTRYYLRGNIERRDVAAAASAAALEHAYLDLRDVLDRRAQELASRCPESCRPLHTWIARRTWRYSQAEKAVRVTLIFGLVCPRAGTKKPAGLPRLPASDEFEADREEDDREYDLTKGWGENWTLDGRGEVVPCGERRLVRFTYAAPVESCDAPGFATHVPRARALARWYLEQLRCRDAVVRTTGDSHSVECRREATLLRTEWVCNAQRKEVVVDVYVAIRCIMPRL